MKRLVATIAVLSVVIATALFAQSDDREEAERREADSRADQVEAKRQQAQKTGEHASMDRKLAELNRLIEDLNRGGQRDRAQQLQRQAQTIVQQLRSGKLDAAAKQLESIFALQGPGNQPRAKVFKRERAERADEETVERRGSEEDKELAQAKRKVAELLANGRIEEAEDLKRRIGEHLQNIERKARANSIEDQIRRLRDSGRVDAAERLERELREHLKREHGEHPRGESDEREREHTEGHEHGEGHEHRKGHELGERVRHLREAAEHLHAAGFHEEGEQAMRNAERLQHQREGHGHAEHVERQMHELGQHLRHVAERLERLEAIVDKIVDRDDDDDRDDEDDDEDDDRDEDDD